MTAKEEDGDSGNPVRDGACIHDSVNSEEYGEKQYQRKQKQYLPGEG